MAGKRLVRISQGDGQERSVSIREATSLKQGLLDYFTDTLRGYRYTDPKVVGNVLTVKNKMGNELMYIAKEV